MERNTTAYSVDFSGTDCNPDGRYTKLLHTGTLSKQLMEILKKLSK